LLGIANDSLWGKFCDLTDLSRVADDPRFCTNAARVNNRTATVGMVQSVLITRNCEEWTSIFAKAGIPCAPIQSLAQVMEHPHTKSSDMVIEYVHKTYGPLKTIAQPIRFDGHRNQPSSPPPLLGEHSIELLRSSGYSESIIQGFLERQIVYSPKIEQKVDQTICDC
jgi:crotonobetainyl-CoA:carnitine CoA-transferase CaiB-like acyl-CoA transferase